MSSLTNVASLARAYKNTIQRIRCEIGQLNSSAAFVLICESQRKVMLWIGSECDPVDRKLAESLAFDVIKEDFYHVGEIECILEGKERKEVLPHFLELMFMELEGLPPTFGCFPSHIIVFNLLDYKRTAKLRSAPIKPNTSISIHTVEKSPVTGSLCLKLLAKSLPMPDGSVPQLNALPDRTPDLVALLIAGKQFDLW